MRHYIVYKTYNSLEYAICVVHFKRIAKNIVDYLSSNSAGLYYYKEVNNRDLYSRFR